MRYVGLFFAPSAALLLALVALATGSVLIGCLGVLVIGVWIGENL